MISGFRAFFGNFRRGRSIFERWEQDDTDSDLLRFFKKTRCGLHNTGSKLCTLAFDIFGSEVFEVRYAERATQRFNVKIDVLTPFVVESVQQKRPDRTAFGTAKPLQFPDIRQEILEFFRRRSDGNVGFFDTFANLLEAAVFD